MPYPVKRKAPKQTQRTFKDKATRRCTISEITRRLMSTPYNPPLARSPYIRLSGKWLERAGFYIGDQIEIIVMKKMLLIQPAKDIHQPIKSEFLQN
ncbi:SymE family type I addiction module toxin [Pinibacter aurantiacus]|uniref:Type I toxin-antitoxin system SymE family toxin n=1 Tax=Pinibacter aurantiacus TaxID=2851599 RepID=A0A9E2W9X7_9BACT|nr:SymE family type I addiction module toxin [Pinibacter aurantiacus]MBV4360437.1 type I toxin-antitoxin system SymE family toxin [Pinibacter aurantiacus]